MLRRTGPTQMVYTNPLISQMRTQRINDCCKVTLFACSSAKSVMGISCPGSTQPQELIESQLHYLTLPYLLAHCPPAPPQLRPMCVSHQHDNSLPDSLWASLSLALPGIHPLSLFLSSLPLGGTVALSAAAVHKSTKVL